MVPCAHPAWEVEAKGARAGRAGMMGRSMLVAEPGMEAQPLVIDMQEFSYVGLHMLSTCVGALTLLGLGLSATSVSARIVCR